MIAYLITAHNEFDAVADLVGRLYEPEDLYCICVNRAAIAEALDELTGLGALPNVRLVATPASAWGGILENLLIGIDFCLKFDRVWQSLIFLTGAHITLTPPSAIRERVSQQFQGKIVLDAVEQPKEFAADREILGRLFDDPFRRDPRQVSDNAQYNPFTYSRLNLTREGISYYIRPGAMRVGWSRSSHFVTNLFPHNFLPEYNEVHVDRQPPMIRKFLERFFEDRPMGACLGWGLLPRDFCDFCLNSSQALTYFALMHKCFAPEEPYFATLAFDPIFRGRIMRSTIVTNAPGAQAVLTMEDVDNALAQRHLFARKAPAGEPGHAFRTEAYTRLGIPMRLDIARLCKPKVEGYQGRLPELLRQHLQFAGTRFTMGILGEKQLAEFALGPDLVLEYQGDEAERTQPAGRQWRWREGGYDAFAANGDPVGRFDGFRSCGNQFFVFGHWPWAEPLTLACVADIAEMLSGSPSSPVLHTTDGLREIRLDGQIWRYWASEKEVGEVVLSPDGAIRAADDPGKITGHWRAAEGGVIAFGLDDMPISLFDQIGGEDGKWHLAGVTWGQQSPVEPCTLVSVARHPLTGEQQPAWPDRVRTAQRLNRIGVKYGTDKSSLGHGYLDFYEQFVEPLQDKAITLLEVGVFMGQSVRMWQEYFPKGRIIGVDIEESAIQYADSRITIVTADQSSVGDLVKLGKEYGPFDIVVDDGSHQWDHQITTLQCLFPFLNPGGLYLLEDIHTSFGEYGSAFKRNSDISAFQYLNRAVEYLAADEYLDVDGEEDGFIRSYAPKIESVAFHRHTAVVRRRRYQDASAAMRDPWPLLAEDPQSLAARPAASLLVHLAFKGDVVNERGLVGGVREVR